MLITVTTTSTDINSLAATAGYSDDIKSILQDGGERRVLVQNLGTDDIYSDYGADATTTGGVRIDANGGSHGFNITDIGKLNLIAAVSNNNVRLEIA